jgi:hypothetical protein
MKNLSRDARPEEIFPGQHGPVRGLEGVGKGDVMTNLLTALQKLMPGWQFTLFMFEPPEQAAKANRLPAFNYGSTVDRPDMLAVLKAFILKNEDPEEYARNAKLDEFRKQQGTEGKA